MMVTPTRRTLLPPDAGPRSASSASVLPESHSGLLVDDPVITRERGASSSRPVSALPEMSPTQA